MRHEAHIGRLLALAHANLLMVDGDPTQDLAPLPPPDIGIVLLMQGGRALRERLG